MTHLSKEAQELLNVLRDEYIEDGFLQSGSWTFESLRGEGFGRKEIKELEDAGLVRRRDCRAYAIELTPMERKRMLAKHHLCSSWFEKYSTAISEIQEEVRSAAAIPSDGTNITVPTMKREGATNLPDEMSVYCPLSVGQVVHLEYDLPKKNTWIGYNHLVEKSPGKQIGQFMVTDIIHNLLVMPRRNMIELQSLNEEFNKIHPDSRVMLLFEDVVLNRLRQPDSISLDDMVARASARLWKQAKQDMAELDKRISITDSPER